MKIHYVRTSNRSSIPRRTGAYVITLTTDNIHVTRYVGCSKNLYQRFNGHRNKNAIYSDLYITDDINLAESLERIFMELIRPAENTQILPLSSEDKEIMEILLRDNKIKQILSDNIIKIGYRHLKYVKGDENNFIFYSSSDKHVVVSDNIHELVIKKQGEFLIKGIRKSMQEITDMAIIKGLDYIKADVDENESQKDVT